MIGELLEELYARYNRRAFVHPDPLEFLYECDDPADREVVGLIASSLAYGRVGQILRSVRVVLDRMGPPSGFLSSSSPSLIRRTFRDFRHRFAGGAQLGSLLLGIRRATRRFGSLEACFLDGFSPDHETVIPALGKFVAELSNADGSCSPGHLLPCPSRGSACKRLALFLRWMVRRDAVDPGGWDVPASKLVVPLDVHMHRISRGLGFTQRKAANLKTAIEVTSAFREFSPADPVKYDFALTRLGIHPGVRKPEAYTYKSLASLVDDHHSCSSDS